MNFFQDFHKMYEILVILPLKGTVHRDGSGWKWFSRPIFIKRGWHGDFKRFPAVRVLQKTRHHLAQWTFYIKTVFFSIIRGSMNTPRLWNLHKGVSPVLVRAQRCLIPFFPIVKDEQGPYLTKRISPRRSVFFVFFCTHLACVHKCQTLYGMAQNLSKGLSQDGCISQKIYAPLPLLYQQN